MLEQFLNDRYTRIARFLIVGSFGAFVNLAVLWLALLIWNDTYLSLGLGIVFSVFSNFVLNSSWTFKDRQEKSAHGGRRANRWISFFERLINYYMASAVAVSVQFLTSAALLYWDIVTFPTIAQIFGILMGTGVNYYVQNTWTFASTRKIKKLDV